MYDELDEDILGSRGLAQICLEEVTAQTGSSNKGIVEGNDISRMEKDELTIFRRRNIGFVLSVPAMCLRH